jgi:hypothetical protein
MKKILLLVLLGAFMLPAVAEAQVRYRYYRPYSRTYRPAYPLYYNVQPLYGMQIYPYAPPPVIVQPVYPYYYGW